MTNRSIPGSVTYRTLDRQDDAHWAITLHPQEVRT